MPNMRKLKPYNKYLSVSYDYVAEVPEGWQLLPNIAVFEERIERGFIDEELLSVTIGRGVIRQTDVDIKKDSSNEDKSKYKLIKIGDIAYNRMRMWQGALGYSNYRGITSPAYVILKPKMEINQRFFHYMFRTGFYTNYSKRFSYGIVDDQLSLRYVDFKRMYSIVPPIETQNDIVTYLDRKTKKTREFIKKKERLIELLVEEKSIIINLAATKGIKDKIDLINVDKEWFNEIPKNWEVKKLYGLCKFIRGNSAFQKDELLEKGDYVALQYGKTYKVDEVTSEYEFYVNSEFYKNTQVVENGDVIFVSTSETIEDLGHSVFYNREDKGLIGGEQILLKPKKFINNKFLYYSSKIFLKTLRKFATGVKVFRVNIDDLKTIYIPFPSLIEQEEIVSYLDQQTERIEKSVSIQQIQIEKAKEYQESLINQVVTGQLKVPTLTTEKALN